MENKTVVRCKDSNGAVWVLCPVCHMSKVLKLREDTRARDLTVFCRQCKHESVVNVDPGEAGAAAPRVTLIEAG